MDVAALLGAATSGGGNTPAQAQVQQALATLAASGAFGPTAAANGASSGMAANPMAFLQSALPQQAQQQQVSQQTGAAETMAAAAAGGYPSSSALAEYVQQAGLHAALAQQQQMAARQAFGLEAAPKGKGKGKGKIDDPIYIALSTAMEHLREVANLQPPQNEGWDFETLKLRLAKYFRAAAKGMIFSGPLEKLINEFADAAFGNISWLLSDCKWLRQADFTLVLEVSVTELFPVDVKAGIGKEEMEEYIVKANDRAIEEAAFTPVLDKIVKSSVHGKKLQNKLYNAAEAARKEAIIGSLQAFDIPARPWEDSGPMAKVKAFVTDFIYRSLKPFGDWPDSIFDEEECVRFFNQCVREGAIPSALTRHLREPIPDPWDFVREKLREHYANARTNAEELNLQNATKKAKKVYSPEENRLVKTEICRNWMDTGTCKFSEWCVFAHGEQELLFYQAKASKGAKGFMNPIDHWREMPGKGKKGPAGFGMDNGLGCGGFDSFGKDSFGKAGCKGWQPKGCMGKGPSPMACGIRGKGIFVPPPGMASGLPGCLDKGMPKGGDDMFQGMPSGCLGCADKGMPKGGDGMFQMLPVDMGGLPSMPDDQFGFAPQPSESLEQPWHAGLAPPGLAPSFAPPGIEASGATVNQAKEEAEKMQLTYDQSVINMGIEHPVTLHLKAELEKLQAKAMT